MCDISIKTEYKQKTVYKVACLIKGKYYSVFSQHELRLGKVITFPDKMKSRSQDMFDLVHRSLDVDSDLYNKDMLGRVSGFALKSDAIDICNDGDNIDTFIGLCISRGYTLVILKIVLAGSILRGTTYRISVSVANEHTTFAGDRIKSIIMLP